jgi:hypothetical protein
MKNPSNLKGLLGFCFGDGINRSNVINLACRFKSPRNHTHLQQGENLKTAGSFRGIAMFHPRNLLLASSLNQRPAASLREQLVECSVFRLHFGPLYRVDDDGGRTRGAICPSTGSPFLVALFSRHQYERADHGGDLDLLPPAERRPFLELPVHKSDRTWRS